MDTLIPAHEATVRPDPAPTAGPPYGGVDVGAFIRR
jgi:hypothetical protein